MKPLIYIVALNSLGGVKQTGTGATQIKKFPRGVRRSPSLSRLLLRVLHILVVVPESLSAPRE
jgi:hypothetical protein